VLILFRLENKEYIKIYSLGDAVDIALNPLMVVSLPTRQDLAGLMAFFWLTS
jgi:ribosomal protein L21E